MARIPSPQEVGLPEKFDSWRAKQEDALSVMITSQKRVTALSAPTGFGKSPTYIAYAILSGLPTCIVTNSKGLQDQLMDDFKSIGLVDIRGRNNYPCTMREDYSCREGWLARCPYKRSVMCPASQAEMRAAVSSLVVTNYDKWIMSKRYSQGMTHFQQVIFDEAHDAPDAVAKAMQIYLSDEDVERLLHLKFPYDVQSIGAWKIWAASAIETAHEVLEELQARVEETDSPKPSWLKQLGHVKDLCRRLAVLALCRPDNWVVDEVEGGFQFDPIRPSQYTEGTLFLQHPRIIMVSATLRPKTMFMLGLSKDKFDFYEFDSDFDRDRCPIYWVPTMRVDIRADDLSPLWVRLDQIISRRRDRKGIVHTVSYARQQDVLKHSRYISSMMVNERGEPTAQVIQSFKESGNGTVLVSPSVGTGYDFPGKDCEWQFMCKIPFPDGRSKIMQARQEQDKEYGPYAAMQNLVQTFGRGMRSKEDRCENFIPDDHLAWFVPRYAHLAPKTFHNFFRRVEILPQPPEALT